MVAFEKGIEEKIGQYVKLKGVEKTIEAVDPQIKVRVPALKQLGSYLLGKPYAFYNKLDMAWEGLQKGIIEDKTRGIEGKPGIEQLEKELSDYVLKHLDEIIKDIPAEVLYHEFVLPFDLPELTRLKNEKYKELREAIAVSRVLTGAEQGDTKARRILLEDYFKEQPFLQAYLHNSKDHEVDDLYEKYGEGAKEYYQNKIVKKVKEETVKACVKESIKHLDPKKATKVLPTLLLLAYSLKKKEEIKKKEK